jgi:phenylpropionate dioxygenase-like ring-hydroxylating dioxygenase large terminal subunit
MTFPDHCWYAIATSGQLSTRPLAIRLLGEEIVLLRTPEGEALAFSSRCAHRGCSLAGGSFDVGHLVCPYHGWKYNQKGECVDIPLLRDHESIPDAAHIRVFAIRESYGLVWLWSSSDLRPPGEFNVSIPEIDSLNPCPGGDISFSYNTHYTRTLENGIDPTHAVFVHGGSIGKPDVATDLTLDPYELICDRNSIYGRMPIKVKKVNGLTQFLLRGDSNPYKEYRFVYPNLVISTIHFGRHSLAALQAHVPEGDGGTTVRVTNARNFLLATPILSQWFDRVTRTTGIKISTEDEAVIGDQLPRAVAFKGSHEVLVRSDEILIAFRRMMRELMPQ